MLNLRKTYQQLTLNRTPLNATRYDNNTKIRIQISEPYNIFGLSPDDWGVVHSIILLNWNDEIDVMNIKLNNQFNMYVRPRFYNILKALQVVESLPIIILSILCQAINDYSLYTFKDDFKPLYVSEYFDQLRMLNPELPKSLSPVSTYIIDFNEDITYANVANGVNMIIWDDNRTVKNLFNDIYGVKHAWDHYDYPHIHQITSFQHHRLLLLNAVKRTWLAMLSVTSGIKGAYTRVNYGYMAYNLLPLYTRQEFQHLSLLNYATVIEPPYEYSRILQLSINEIEKIIIKTLSCFRITPTLNTIYITSKQLHQEQILGNTVVMSRITIVQSIVCLNDLVLYEQYNNIQLPVGPTFSPTELLSEVEVHRTVGRPEYIVNAAQTKNVIKFNDLANVNDYFMVESENYKTYLDILRNSAKRQYLTSSILKSISSDGISISAKTLPERAIAYVSLNRDSHGVNLDLGDQMPIAIFELTNSTYIDDYGISLNLLSEMMKFKQFLNVSYGSMNVVVISPDIYPSTFMKIANQTAFPTEVLSLNGTMGLQIDSLFSFNVMKANMLFITITEENYLESIDSYELFLSDIKPNTYYSLEFLDFNTDNLVAAVGSVIEVLQLITDSEYVKIQLAPLILNPFRVGLRLVFCLSDYPDIATSYRLLQRQHLEIYSRCISTDTIVIDPIKSLTYPNTIIPRMGTQLIARCNSANYSKALGYMSSLCRYVTSDCHSLMHTYYELYGVVDQSRIVVMDRLEMFRENTYIKPEQLLPKEKITRNDKTSRLTFFELVTQTDRMLLYLLRRKNGLLPNNISDYGSAHFLNLCMTDNEYIMYDIDKIELADVPSVRLIQNVLEWGVPLPYIENTDVLIYNSIFMNPKAVDDDMSIPIINMLRPLLVAKNIYFNLPVMTPQLYEVLLSLNIVEHVRNRYFLKLSKYPLIPCLSEDELRSVLSMFPSPQYTVRQLKPTLLDYYFSSRMIQRFGNYQIYNNALVLHQCIPLLVISS
ncbi:VP4 [Bercke-Baary Melophagus reo-like virus]|nr:VP4 [Bercke-Baary Melophagus reo-like virus]UJG27948.1 VP4 [Bercke-Baary Melophagus reo-like virus]